MLFILLAILAMFPFIKVIQFFNGSLDSIWIQLITTATFSLILWKLKKYVYIRYQSTISIYDGCFTVDNQKYFWHQIEWHRASQGGKLSLAFDIGLHKIKSPLRFFIEAKWKQNNNSQDFYKMRRAILNGIYDHGVQTRNYYDTKFHRRLARAVLTSNLVILAVLLALEVKINYALPFFLFWAISSLPYPIIIFTKQEVEVYKD
jgi:hypothetical protein